MEMATPAGTGLWVLLGSIACGLSHHLVPVWHTLTRGHRANASSREVGGLGSAREALMSTREEQEGLAPASLLQRSEMELPWQAVPGPGSSSPAAHRIT